MLLDTKKEITWNNATKKWYEDKGYIFTKSRDVFSIKITDMKPTSTIKVNVKCDICGKNHLKEYRKYLKGRENIDIDCCSSKKCLAQKSKVINLKLYGVENPMQYKEFRELSNSKLRTPFSKVESFFKGRKMVIVSDEKDYKNRESVLKVVCENHPSEIQYMSFKKVLKNSTPCKFCKEENDFANINSRLRNCISEWKKQTEEKSNYSCVITGSKNYEIHHLKPFNQIVREAFNNLNYSIENYNEVTFERIKNEVKRLHFFYGLGVCLDKKLHKQFHSIYGYDFKKEDFLKFKQNLYIKMPRM